MLSVRHNIFHVLEINYCLSRELYLGIVTPSSSLTVLSLFICIYVCELYGRWTFLKIFRNRESKVSLTLITASVFMCLCHWLFQQWGLYSCTANYLESVLWIITTCHRYATFRLCNYKARILIEYVHKIRTWFCVIHEMLCRCIRTCDIVLKNTPKFLPFSGSGICLYKCGSRRIKYNTARNDSFMLYR